MGHYSAFLDKWHEDSISNIRGVARTPKSMSPIKLVQHVDTFLSTAGHLHLALTMTSLIQLSNADLNLLSTRSDLAAFSLCFHRVETFH